MIDSSEWAVLRAVVLMRDRLGEPLTMDELARSVMFSRSHFTRVFHHLTGVPPRCFLSEMRLHRAKQVLATTEQTIAHICAHVGYSSVGTFSARFSRRVGVSPTGYRELARLGAAGAPPGAAISGRVWTCEDAPPLIYVGLFADRAQRGRPARCTVLDGSGPYLLAAVPAGTWSLVGQAVSPGRGGGPAPAYVGARSPITVGCGTEVRTDLELKPVDAPDPPLRRALTDVRKHALSVLTAELTGRC